MRTRREAWKLLAAAIVLLAVAATLAAPPFAMAEDSSEARNEFSSSELSRLFERASSYEDCDFIMRDYRTGTDTYLKVRSQFRTRYEKVVGDDSVRPILEEDEPSSREAIANIRPGMPLELVAYSGAGAWSPWRDVLSLRSLKAGDPNPGRGTAFLVSPTVAITAAHNVMSDGVFALYLSGESSVGISMYDHDEAMVSKAIVQKEWASEGPQKVYDHDFAILVFDSAPEGTSGSGSFHYAGMSAAESLTYSINCAGYLGGYDGTSGYQLWRNKNNGSIPALDNLPPGGNDFAMSLSVVQGMSGGPVYRISDGRYIAVGIVSHMNVTSGWNYACRITERLQVLAAWAQEGGYANIAPSGGGGSPSTGVADFFDLGAVGDAARQAAEQSVGPDGMAEALEGARAANPDVVAWLCVPGCGVSLPVARREGSDGYYLDHGPDGSPSQLGCAYLEGADAADLSDPVTVVYAHTYPNAPLMFSGLHRLADPSAFAACRRAWVATADGRLLGYRIVEAAYYGCAHLGGLVDESDPASVQAYFDPFADPDPSGFEGLRRPVALDAASDRVLQLSTCTVPAQAGARWVVTGVLESERPLAGGARAGDAG